MTKALESLGRLGIQKTNCNILQAICSNHTANINRDGEKLKAFPGIIGKHNYSFILFRVVGDILSIAIRQEIKVIQMEKEEVKVDLFVDDIISYIPPKLQI